MIHDYPNPLDNLPRGQVMTPQPDIAAAIEHTARLNLGLAVHAIGDGAVRATLDAAHSVSSSLRLPVSHLRIEHCEFIDEADVPRFADLRVTASVQPCHLLADIEGLNRHIPHRLDRVLPLKDLIESGLEPGKTLLFGSDVPVVRPDPQDSIQAAVHRKRADQPASEAIAPDQAITGSQAWACFSRQEV
jgi:predicted amidohydrolase YtcJ